MWGKMWKPFGKLGCSKAAAADCMSRSNQVENEAVHGANLAAQRAATAMTGCHLCVEESKVCKGEHGLEEGDKYIEQQPATAEANSSFAHAVINMIGMLIGLGLLSTPYALENGGWASSFLLIGLGIICTYSAHILGECLEKNPRSRSYVDIGQHAFGSKGRIVAATFIYLEIFMALVSCTISLHDNLITVFAGTRLKLSWGANLSTSQILTVVAVLVALPSLWLRNLSSISFLSFGGVFMSFLIFISVPCTAIFGGVKANHKIPVLQIDNIPVISGLYMYGYAGHIVFPDLYKSMKDPSKFTKVSIVSFASATAIYTSLAFMGAKLFGSGVKSQITLSMPRHLFVTKIALWATVLTPMTKYALEFAPFAIQLEHHLPAKMSSRTKLLIRATVGSIVLISILILALCVPYFEHVLSLTGSLVSVCICVIFPCAFYIKICRPQISKSLIFLNLILIAFGSILGVCGTFFSSKSLLQHLMSRSAHST